MTPVVIVQARLSSARLPSKVLLPLAGAPAILRMMERVVRVGLPARVATSDQPSDDPLVEALEAAGVTVVRGPLDDVLSRFTLALPKEADTVVRLTGDCPLVDPSLVRRHLDRHRAAQPFAEYTTNAVVRTEPDGLDVEVIARPLLERAAREATRPYDREHVTPWIKRHARTVPVAEEEDLSPLRLTLDTRADYEQIAAIYDALYPEDPTFDTRAVLRLLVARPELIRVAGSEELPPSARRAFVARIKRRLEETGS